MSTKKFISIYLTLAATFLGISPSTWASGETSFAILAGVSHSNGFKGIQSNENKFSFGGKLHHRLVPHFGLGVTYSYIDLYSEVFKSPSYMINSMHFDGDISYHFTKSTIGGLWIGGRVGMGRLASYSGITEHDKALTAFEYGPAVGFDHRIADDVSIGLDINYLRATYREMRKILGVFQGFGVLKIHW